MTTKIGNIRLITPRGFQKKWEGLRLDKDKKPISYLPSVQLMELLSDLGFVLEKRRSPNGLAHPVEAIPAKPVVHKDMEARAKTKSWLGALLNSGPQAKDEVVREFHKTFPYHISTLIRAAKTLGVYSYRVGQTLVWSIGPKTEDKSKV